LFIQNNTSICCVIEDINVFYDSTFSDNNLVEEDLTIYDYIKNINNDIFISVNDRNDNNTLPKECEDCNESYDQDFVNKTEITCINPNKLDTLVTELDKISETKIMEIIQDHVSTNIDNSLG
jgi:hypothetical protein